MNYKSLTERENTVLKKLTSEENENTINSYSVLNSIAEDPERCIATNRYYGNQLFNFYRLKVRSEIFQSFSSFYSFNFGCIKFDAEISQQNGYMTKMNSDHFLFIDSNNLKAPYYMMGLNTNDQEDCYVETLFANVDMQKMFKGQNISYPIMITINDEKNLIQKDASYSEKLSMLKQLKLIEEKTGARVDAYYDQLMIYSHLASVEEKASLAKRMSR